MLWAGLFSASPHCRHSEVPSGFQISLTSPRHGKYKIEIERNRKRPVTSRKSDVQNTSTCGGRHATGHPSSFPAFDSILIGSLFSVRGSSGQLPGATPRRGFRCRGAVMTNVTVTITETGTGIATHTRTDDKGEYFLPDCVPLPIREGRGPRIPRHGAHRRGSCSRPGIVAELQNATGGRIDFRGSHNHRAAARYGQRNTRHGRHQ